VTLSTGGFSRVVAAPTAPIATGWSDSCRVGFAPTGPPNLCTAHCIVWARRSGHTAHGHCWVVGWSADGGIRGRRAGV